MSKMTREQAFARAWLNVLDGTASPPSERPHFRAGKGRHRALAFHPFVAAAGRRRLGLASGRASW